MPWFFPFLLSWLLFAVFLDCNRLKETLPFGFITMAMELLVDISAVKLGLYDIDLQVVNFFGVSLFFTIGPAFTLGILYVQNIPKNKLMIVINTVVWALMFMAEEVLWVREGAIVYINWSHIKSLCVDIGAFTLLTVLYYKKRAA